jgi:iron complex outermembrane receptor protein
MWTRIPIPAGLQSPADRRRRAAKRLVDYSHWRVDTESELAQQDLEWRLNPRLQLVGGLSYEHKDLQRRFAVRAGPLVPPALFDPATYADPGSPSRHELADNLIDTKDRGVYLLGRYELATRLEGDAAHTLHLGVRRDDNSEYGGTTSLRGGYVGRIGRFGWKLLYGEGFLEPPPSVAYSVTSAGQSIEPITTHTTQLDLSYTGAVFKLTVDAYRLNSDGAFGGTRLDRYRVGDTVADGVDVLAEWRVPGWSLGSIKLWLYGSWLDAEQSREVAPGIDVDEAPGDMAEHKLWAGVSWEPRANWQLVARGRWMDQRETVFSNPLGEVDSYAVLDLALHRRALFGTALDLGLSLQNALDESYAQPWHSQRERRQHAGSFDPNGLWTGSAAAGNSLFPQEGRGLFFTLSHRFD